MPVRLLQFQRHLLLGLEQLRPPKQIFEEPPRKASCLFESRLADDLSANQKSSGIDGGIGSVKSASLQRLVGHSWRVCRYQSTTDLNFRIALTRNVNRALSENL